MIQNFRTFIGGCDRNHDKKGEYAMLQMEWMKAKNQKSRFDKLAEIYNYYIKFPDEIDEALTLPYETLDILISKTWI